MADDKPEIFIDEDWKAKVQREKEQVKDQAGQEGQEHGAENDAAPEDEGQAGGPISPRWFRAWLRNACLPWG